jgi:hypothetical protein
MTRDFVGYGAEPPHAEWPGDARIAVNFVINFEEGSELSYPAGDGVSEGGLTEMTGADLGVRGRDLLGLHMRLTGHPGRAKALIRFIEYLRSHDRVWICRREDIARHWISRFPPPA